VAQVADSNWGAAINETGNRYGAMTMLLGLAERWQLKRERGRIAPTDCPKISPRTLGAACLGTVVSGCRQHGGSASALRRIVFRIPQEVGLKNNLAAACLLLKTNVPQACRWAEESYAGKTNDLVIASTYAFALHLQGRTKEGLVVMHKLDAHQLEQRMLRCITACCWPPRAPQMTPHHT